MRETIKGILEYINENCEKGRDDLEISELYSCIASLHFALDAIRRVERRNCCGCYENNNCDECMYED